MRSSWRKLPPPPPRRRRRRTTRRTVLTKNFHEKRPKRKTMTNNIEPNEWKSNTNPIRSLRRHSRSRAIPSFRHIFHEFLLHIRRSLPLLPCRRTDSFTKCRVVGTIIPITTRWKWTVSSLDRTTIIIIRRPNQRYFWPKILRHRRATPRCSVHQPVQRPIRMKCATRRCLILLVKMFDFRPREKTLFFSVSFQTARRPVDNSDWMKIFSFSSPSWMCTFKWRRNALFSIIPIRKISFVCVLLVERISSFLSVCLSLFCYGKSQPTWRIVHREMNANAFDAPVLLLLLLLPQLAIFMLESPRWTRSCFSSLLFSLSFVSSCACVCICLSIKEKQINLVRILLSLFDLL